MATLSFSLKIHVTIIEELSHYLSFLNFEAITSRNE